MCGSLPRGVHNNIMIIAFLEGIHSSHGNVLLNMRYNSTLIAIIFGGSHAWLVSSVEYQLKGQKFNAVLRAFLNVDCGAENFTSSTQHYKPFKLRAQVLIKKYVMMDVQMTHLRYNFNNFSMDMSSMIGDWSHVWQALSVDCRQKCYKINAAKQAIWD